MRGDLAGDGMNAAVRTALLDDASARADDLCPWWYTSAQRARLESIAEEAAVAGRDVDAEIIRSLVGRGNVRRSFAPLGAS